MSNWLSHSSILGHIGGYVDRALNPISWATGGKWTHLTSDVLPEKVNSGLSAVMKPFDKVDQTINPVRKIPIVNRVSNIVAAKPGDALAIAAGAYFGGMAALGGGAGGGVAGGGGAAAGAGGAAGEGTAMGGAAGTLGAADSAAASSGLGLTAGDVGAGAAAGGGADVGGLAAADSAAVDAEGAAPGLTEGYGPAQAAPSASSQFQQGGGQQQQQEDPRKKQLQQLPVMQMPTLEQREAALMVDSSRALKTSPGPVSMQAIVHAGASGADQITENGVHIGAIRALHTKIANLEAIAKQRGIAV